MNKKFKQLITAALILAILVTLAPLHADAAITENASLKKLTDSYVGGSGIFTLTSTARLFVLSAAAPSEQLQQTAELINAEFAAAGIPSSSPLPLVWGDRQLVCKGDIILELVDDFYAEEYRLTVTNDNITVSAADTSGLLYGAFMALRHFRVYNGNQIPACTVQDKPDTKERTVMLDCARKYWSVEWIKNLIRQMAWMGYNTLELHLTEDQGIHANIWRDANGNVVKDCNGNDFGWLPGYKAAKWASDANNGQITGVPVQDPNGASNYNRDDLIEILNCAKEYHIDVIPGVDVPGHCDYLIYRWEQSGASGYFTYNYKGRNYSNRPDSIYVADSLLYPNDTYKSYGTLNIANEFTKNMSIALIEAYADFFKQYGNSSKVNIGCDEIRGSLNYSTFVSYVNEVCAAMKEKGFRVRAFNDYLYRSSDTLDPDLEICYWTTTSYKNASNHTVTVPVSAYINDGRTMYNCVNNYTYYVLRYNASQGDARSPSCLQWSFHHSTEERIYSGCGATCACQGVSWNLCRSSSGWNPSKLSAVSDSSEYYYDGAQLGGGYFLIWGDWAGWRTETQVWNGDSGGAYNLIDRMWSNSIKMWNWDIDKTLSYSNYSPVRNLYRIYPGYTAPSSAPSIPAASVLHRAADFTALQKAIATVPAYPQSDYSQSSYAAYETALSQAKAVCARTGATQEEVDAACSALTEAYQSLKLLTSTTIVFKTMVGTQERIIETREFADTSVQIELSGLRGYRYQNVEGNATLTPFFSGVEGGLLTGTAPEIIVWCENDPQLTTLARLLAADDAIYSGNSAYAEQKARANAFYLRVKDAPQNYTMQGEIDEYVNRLVDARSGVALSSSETKIILLKTTADAVAEGKSAVVLVTTSPDVESVTIEGVTLNDYEGKLTTTDSGETVKIWYLSFVMTSACAEPYSYTVTASGAASVSDSFSIRCE